MIKRSLQQELIKALQNMPVVALLGARQVGKTTLALFGTQIVKTGIDLSLKHELDLEDVLQCLCARENVFGSESMPVS